MKYIIIFCILLINVSCKTTQTGEKIRYHETVYFQSENKIIIYADKFRWAGGLLNKAKIKAANHCKKYDKYAFYYQPIEKEWLGININTGEKPFVDIFYCFNEKEQFRNSDELDPEIYKNYFRLKLHWTNITPKEEAKIQKEKQTLQKKILEEEKINKKITTCNLYGFEKGTLPFKECIDSLNNLELEHEKLKNEQLLIKLQIEEAKQKNNNELLQELQLQAIISQQSQVIELNNFNSGMELLMNGLELMGDYNYNRPDNTPIITCQEIGLITQCY